MKKIVVLILMCSEFIFAQQGRENLFGFATSNTFTYCDINDTFFLNKIIKLVNVIFIGNNCIFMNSVFRI